MAKYLGSHVSMKAPNYYVDSILELLHNGANTLMLYTGAPQNTNRCSIDKELTNFALKKMVKMV